MPLEVGAAAPEFTLKDQDRNDVSLADYRGRKNVLLVFYPLAFTGTCQGEMCQLRDNLGQYQNDDTEVLSVSVDSPPTHQKWAEEQGFEFPLLSDFWPHGEVARAYGVFNDIAGIANRGTFLVDRDGVIRYAEMLPPGESRDQAKWLAALAEVGSGS